jgi:hypothetical protein
VKLLYLAEMRYAPPPPKPHGLQFEVVEKTVTLSDGTEVTFPVKVYRPPDVGSPPLHAMPASYGIGVFNTHL